MNLQNAEMHSKGIGWRAEACPASGWCDEGLCVQGVDGKHWHPADPLAFAKWRVRAKIGDIPAEVLVTQTLDGVKAVSRAIYRRVAVVGAVGLTAAAGILAVWLGRRARAVDTCPM